MLSFLSNFSKDDITRARKLDIQAVRLLEKIVDTLKKSSKAPLIQVDSDGNIKPVSVYGLSGLKSALKLISHIRHLKLEVEYIKGLKKLYDGTAIDKFNDAANRIIQENGKAAANQYFHVEKYRGDLRRLPDFLDPLILEIQKSFNDYINLIINKSMGYQKSDAKSDYKPGVSPDMKAIQNSHIAIFNIYEYQVVIDKIAEYFHSCYSNANSKGKLPEVSDPYLTDLNNQLKSIRERTKDPLLLINSKGELVGLEEYIYGHNKYIPMQAIINHITNIENMKTSRPNPSLTFK